MAMMADVNILFVGDVILFNSMLLFAVIIVAWHCHCRLRFYYLVYLESFSGSLMQSGDAGLQMRTK